jgi:hypothetical protein
MSLKFVKYINFKIKIKYIQLMSFLAPYAFTGAVSLYLGYQTYSSYYSNLDFEEINNEDIDIIEDDKDNKPVTKDLLVKEGKKRGEEIKIIIEEVKDEIEDLSYRNVSEVIEKTLEKIEEEEETTEVVLSDKIPETVFPEVENVVTKTSPKKKKKKKKNNKKK